MSAGLSFDFNSAKPWRTLWGLYRAQRRDLIAGELFYLLKASPVWVIPIVTANIIDAISLPRPEGIRSLWINAAVGAVMIVQNIPAGMLYGRFSSRAIRGMETSLRSALVRQLQLLSISSHQRLNSGSLQTKVLRDVEALEQMSRQLIDAGSFAVVSVIVALVVTALRMPVFVPVFFLLLPIIAFIRVTLSSKMRRYNAEFRSSIEQMSAKVTGMIAMVPVTRAHASEDEAISRVEKSLDDVSEAGQRLDRHGALFGAVAWVQFMLLQLGILVMGAWCSMNGKIGLSAGDLVLLSGYAAAIVAAVMQLNSMLPVITRGFEAVRSIGEIIEHSEVEENEGKPALREVKGEFRFEDVHFQYPEGENGGRLATLHGLDFRVDAGETIGIVGPSGSGKSTLMSLIIGFYRPSQGRVLVDGNDMHALDLRAYRSFLSVVSQETLLFEGTLRENITYGMEDVSEERLWDAIRGANSCEFVRSLPEGVDSHVGERGCRLSGGQRQRIAIARALLRDPRVLILDEATSALDGGSEAIVQDALDRLMQARTTFIVAHRLSTLRRADRILVLDGGRVVESGRPCELACRFPERYGALL